MPGQRKGTGLVVGHREGKGLGMRRASEFPLLPLPGVLPTTLGMWSLLLLWGLATPCQGLLETVGTLARIDKDELGKGEPATDSCEGPSGSANDPILVLGAFAFRNRGNRLRFSTAERIQGPKGLLADSEWLAHFLLRGGLGDLG